MTMTILSYAFIFLLIIDAISHAKNTVRNLQSIKMRKSMDYEILTGYWVISSQELGKALFRVSKGEDPGDIYTELYANTRMERPA